MEDRKVWTICRSLLTACEEMLDMLRQELTAVTDIPDAPEPAGKAARQRAIDLLIRTMADVDRLVQELREVLARLGATPQATEADRRLLRDLARRATVLGNARAQMIASLRKPEERPAQAAPPGTEKAE